LFYTPELAQINSAAMFRRQTSFLADRLEAESTDFVDALISVDLLNDRQAKAVNELQNNYYKQNEQILEFLRLKSDSTGFMEKLITALNESGQSHLSLCLREHGSIYFSHSLFFRISLYSLYCSYFSCILILSSYIKINYLNWYPVLNNRMYNVKINAGLLDWCYFLTRC